ncbi:MAG TPA: hypothetical protein VN937_23980 [Blastocatellia bacterium]|nr:hypothetical protein [Blastocatellia bacterium]
MTALGRYFLAPTTPNIAAGFVDDNFAVVDLRRGRRGFSLASSAVTQLPEGLITPSFESLNIQDEEELAGVITQTAQAAGLANKKRWSVALPDATARTLVVALESKPSNSRELNEVIEWKLERLVSVPPAELRTSRQKLRPVAGEDRYLITVSRDEVLSQYENVFANLGWKAGLILPRHLGEAQWLMWDDSAGDKMLVTAHHSGFTSLIVRNGEPALVRTFVCERDSIRDELHRFALYYRDRLVDAGGATAGALSRMLVLGGIDLAEARRAVADALESEPRTLDPAEFGIDLKGEPIRFDQLAGAAGLATIAWQ